VQQSLQDTERASTHVETMQKCNLPIEWFWFNFKEKNPGYSL